MTDDLREQKRRLDEANDIGAKIEKLRELYEDWRRYEGAIHGGTGTGLQNCYSYEAGHREFGEWLIDGFSDLLSEIDRLSAALDRAVVLPDIPYNKTLYWIWGDMIMPVRYRGIRGGCVTEDGKFHVSCDMVTKKPRTFKSTYRRKPYEHTYPAGDQRGFYADDVGKTVFLARAQAEAAMEPVTCPECMGENPQECPECGGAGEISTQPRMTYDEAKARIEAARKGAK
jgi:hypothetical protein